MKGFLCYLILLCFTAWPPLYAQDGKGTVEQFYKALGKRDFTGAYQLCTGANWGTLQQFSSTKMYGGIYSVTFSKCSDTKTGQPQTAEVEADVFVRDSVNGDGRFVQRFFLVQKNGQWRIRSISLLQTDRAIQGWNLKLVVQTGLGEKELQSLLQPVYDTASKRTDDGEPFDKLERTITDPRFFQTPGGIYAAVVVQNGCNDCGAAYVGWCDVFIFLQTGGRWIMTDFLLRAGGGGMYGHSGIAEKPLLRTGTATVGLVITGGQYHMGELYSFDNILAIRQGKLSDLVSVTTHYDNENTGNEQRLFCQENTYRFLPSGKACYDLQLVLHNCLGKGREAGRVIIPYSNNGYKIPQDYLFEM